MGRRSVGRWSWFLAAVSVSVLGLAGCGGGGGGGGGVSPFTRVGGNNNSGDLGAALSQTGRFVAFSSRASDLTGAGNDTNDMYDIFVLDRQTGDTTVASRVSGTASLKVANADDASFYPAISGDGSKVAFESRANNLVGPGDPVNAVSDIFVHNRDLNTTERVSQALLGAPTDGPSFKPSLSTDGRYVAFYSQASNLVAGDANGLADVFRYDRTGGTTTRISGVAGGAVFGHSVSDNGARVAFESPPGGASRDIFVWDSGTVIPVTAGDNDSRVSGISGNGRYVVFDSDATNLVAGDNNSVSDVFVADLSTTPPTITRVSVATGGGQATGGGSFALGHKAISDDGNLVVFESDATNLGAAAPAFYVHDRAANTTTALAATAPLSLSGGVTISGDGSTAVIATDDALAGEAGGLFDLFIMAVP